MCLRVVEETATVRQAARRAEIVDGWKWVDSRGRPGCRQEGPPITERWQRAKLGEYVVGNPPYVLGFHIFLEPGPRPSYIHPSCQCVPVRIRGVLARGRQTWPAVVGLYIRRRRLPKGK